ncbi:MAG: hypothetical protein JW719_11985 [Pirellulales bacterium]|nr:hypothetical protein [Pirellulales bacterium]
MMACPAGAIRVAGCGVSPENLLPMPKTEDRATAEGLASLLLARQCIAQHIQSVCRETPAANH